MLGLDLVGLLAGIIVLPLIFFVPGYFTFHALRPSKATLDGTSSFQVLFYQVVASILVSGWIALVLLQLGQFDLWLLAVSLTVYSTGLAIAFRLNPFHEIAKSFSNLKLSWETLFLLVLILLAIGLFCHASEEINLSHDIGSYINTGASISGAGSIVFVDPVMSSMPAWAQNVFYLTSPDGLFYLISPDGRLWYEGVQFPDFTILDRVSGSILLWKPILREVWFATFYDVWGLRFALYSQPVFGLMGVLSVFFAAKTIWNWKVAAVASLVLAVSYLQVFFSQYTSQEMLAQFLVFAGIGTLILFTRTYDRFFGIVSAMSFGQALITRFEVLLVAVPVIITVLYLLLKSRDKRIMLYFVLPFSALWTHFIISLNYYNLPYLAHLLTNVNEAYGFYLQPTVVVFLLTLVLVLILLVGTFAVFRKRNDSRLLSWVRDQLGGRYLPHLLTSAALLGLLYLWLSSPAGGLSPISVIPRGPVDTLVSLSWFMGWFGVGLGFFGLLMMFYESPRRETYMFLGFVSLALIASLFTLAVTPVFPWAMRRTVIIVLPAIAIFIGYAIDRIGRSVKRTLGARSIAANAGRVAIIVLALAIVVPSLNMDQQLLTPQYENFIQQLDDVADFFPENAIVLDAATGLVARISAPLKYIYGKDSIHLWTESPDQNGFIEMVRLWEGDGKEVYLIVTSDSTLESISGPLEGSVDFAEEAIFALTFTTTAWERGTFSNTRVTVQVNLKVLRLTVL